MTQESEVIPSQVEYHTCQCGTLKTIFPSSFIQIHLSQLRVFSFVHSTKPLCCYTILPSFVNFIPYEQASLEAFASLWIIFTHSTSSICRFAIDIYNIRDRWKTAYKFARVYSPREDSAKKVVTDTDSSERWYCPWTGFLRSQRLWDTRLRKYMESLF